MAPVCAAAGLLNPACSTHDCAVPCLQATAASPAPAVKAAAAALDPDDPLSQPPHGTEVRSGVPLTATCDSCTAGTPASSSCSRSRTPGGAPQAWIVFAQPCQSAAPSLPARCQQAGSAGFPPSCTFHSQHAFAPMSRSFLGLLGLLSAGVRRQPAHGGYRGTSQGPGHVSGRGGCCSLCLNART